MVATNQAMKGMGQGSNMVKTWKAKSFIKFYMYPLQAYSSFITLTHAHMSRNMKRYEKTKGRTVGVSQYPPT
jgi:hypothetical protein